MFVQHRNGVTGSTNIVESCRHGPMTEEERLADERDKALMQCMGVPFLLTMTHLCEPWPKHPKLSDLSGSKTFGGWNSTQKWGASQEGRCGRLASLGETGFRCRSRSDRSYFHYFASISWKEKALAAIKNATIALQNGQQLGRAAKISTVGLQMFAVSCSTETPVEREWLSVLPSISWQKACSGLTHWTICRRLPSEVTSLNLKSSFWLTLIRNDLMSLGTCCFPKMFATTVFFCRLWRTLSSGICQSVKAKRNLWRKTWTRQRNDRARGVRTAIWGQTRTLCSSKVNFFLIELRFGWHGIKQHLKSEPWYSEFIQTWHVIFWSDIAIHRWHDRLSEKPQKERKLFVSWKAWSGVCFFKCALSSAQSSPSPVHQSCSFHLQMKANIACAQPFWCMRGNTRSLIWEMNRKSLQSWDAWTVSLFDLESRI